MKHVSKSNISKQNKNRRIHKTDDFLIEEVAARLGVSARWLNQRLADDRLHPPAQQKLQFHHYIGRTKQWTKKEFKNLKRAIAELDTKKYLQTQPGYKLSSATVSITSTARSGSKSEYAGYENLLAFA